MSDPYEYSAWDDIKWGLAGLFLMLVPFIVLGLIIWMVRSLL